MSDISIFGCWLVSVCCWLTLVSRKYDLDSGRKPDTKNRKYMYDLVTRHAGAELRTAVSAVSVQRVCEHLFFSAVHTVCEQ